MRAVLAVVLLIGFYVLAVVLASGLLWIPYAEWSYLHRIDFRIAVACIGAGGAILWSLRPRRDAFVAPGPQLFEEVQPRLFEMIRDVAALTGEVMPAEVFLIPDVNAYVAQRGGFFGFGSRRIMGLGLPLLSVFTIDELKAVLAHEFGHYRGGDVRLGPLVYRTRAAIGRTLQGTAGSFIEGPFVAYGELFLKVSSSVSRHQEFVADGVAARAVGAAPLGTGLCKVYRAAFAFQWYMASEVAPVIRSGRLPPISSGFSEFFAAPMVRTALESLKQPTTSNEYDSHPPLAQRLDAIGFSSDVESNSDRAVTLLGELEQLEFETFRFRKVQRSLTPISWTSVITDVSVPLWRQTVENCRSTLEHIEVDHLPSTMQESIRLASNLKAKGEGYVKGDELARRLGFAIGSAVSLMLHDRGWKCQTGPGQTPVFTFGDDHLAPFETIVAVVSGREPLETWAAACRQHDLRGRLG